MKNDFWKVGKNYCIRTVTMIQIGKLVGLDEHEIILENASWIPETGIWSKFLDKGAYNENEPFPDGIIAVGRSSIIDACIWKHDLPRTQK